MTSSHRDDPANHANAPHPSVTDARQGVTTHHVRWILAASLALATGAIVVAWIWISSTH